MSATLQLRVVRFPRAGVRLELVTVLSDAYQLRLRTALSHEFVVTNVESVTGPNGLAESLESRAVDLLVVDPADRRMAGHVGALTELLTEYHWVPCAIYTSLSSAGIKPVVELAKHGVRGLLLAGADDNAVNIRSLVERLTADAVADQLLSALERPMDRLPPPVARAIRGAFGAPHRYPTVEDIALKANVTGRHLHRVITAVGLTSPLKIVVAARVLRAYQLFRWSETMTLDDAAKRLRLDPRMLSNQIRTTLGLNSVAPIRDLAPPDVVTRCVRMLYRPPMALVRAGGDVSPA